MNTQPETNETLQVWVTPRLQRLNQADGTDKHIPNAVESGYTCGGPTTGGDSYGCGSGFGPS